MTGILDASGSESVGRRAAPVGVGSGRKHGLVARLYLLAGPKVAALFVAAVPIGVALGIIEIVTASVLYAVLVEFNLVSGAPISSRFTLGLSPVITLFVITTIATALRFSGQLLPAFANHSLNARLREAMVRNTLGGFTEQSVVSVAESSHLLSHLIPKSGDFVHSLVTTTVGACLLLLILAGLLHISWQLTAIALLLTAILGALLLLLRQRYGKYIEAMYAIFRQFNLAFLKDLRNNHLLRISGANEQECERLTDLSRRHIQSFRRYFVLYAFSTSIPNLAGTILIVGVFWLNAQIQFLPTAGLVPLVYLLYRTAGSVGTLGVATGQLRENRPYFDELMRHLPEFFPGANEDVIDRGAMPETLFPLVVTGLSFGRDAALTPPISFSARAGDTVVIHGPSGKGKTTLLMTLVALLKPLGGAISWGGLPVERIDPTRLRRRLGYAGPEPYLLDADIRANLLFGLEGQRVGDAEIETALRVACAEFVFDRDIGLDFRLREAGDGISAGQKQRLALARCFLRKPEVMLLDEATSNLDEETEARIMQRLKAAFPDILLVAVSHRASLRRYATATLEI